jgi:hypothetical protein
LKFKVASELYKGVEIMASFLAGPDIDPAAASTYANLRLLDIM